MTHRPVRSVMTTDVIRVHLDDSVKAIAVALWQARVSAVPVVDVVGRVVGVVSEQDLLHKVTYQDDDSSWPALLRRHHVDRRKADALSARNLMTAPPVTIGPEASVVEAARTMERHHVKRLPIVERDGSLIGVVSRADVIGLLTRGDDEIRAEVEAEVLRRPLLLAPNDATADVNAGVVTLRGTMPRRSDAEIAAFLTHRLDGVIGVRNELTYVANDVEDDALRYESGRAPGRYF